MHMNVTHLFVFIILQEVIFAISINEELKFTSTETAHQLPQFYCRVWVMSLTLTIVCIPHRVHTPHTPHILYYIMISVFMIDIRQQEYIQQIQQDNTIGTSNTEEE